MKVVLVLLAVLGVLGIFAFCSSGNAYQKISVGPWEEVGKDEAPVSGEPVDFVIDTTQVGTGTEVRPGDLVRVRLNERVVWLWVGHEPPAREGPYDSPFGNMGSPDVRKGLIGRKEHEKFNIRLNVGRRRSVAIPAHVFLPRGPATSG